MAELIITVPDGVVSRVLDGICYQNRYQDEVIDETTPEGEPIVYIPNPETKVNFAKRMIRVYVKENVKAWEATTSSQEARIAAIESVEDDITIS